MMLPKWLTALLVLLQEAWSTRRDAHIRFLKLQVEMLKERLPGNRVILDPVERRRLMKVGAEVDHKVEDTLEIVSVKTYRRWQREERGGREPGKVGRPRLTKSLRELIIRLAKENAGWGVRRIVGELKNWRCGPAAAPCGAFWSMRRSCPIRIASLPRACRRRGASSSPST